MEEIPFKTKTDLSRKILDETIEKRIIPKISNIKLLCPLLGPGDMNKEQKDAHKLRKSCRDHINNMGHISFFLEEISDKDVQEYLLEKKLDKIRVKAISEDRESMNNLLIYHSDIVFMVCEGEGAMIELGKYGKMCPNKLRIFLPACAYYLDDTQKGMELKKLEESCPNCILTYNDEQEAHNKIDDCLSVEFRKRMWE